MPCHPARTARLRRFAAGAALACGLALSPAARAEDPPTPPVAVEATSLLTVTANVDGARVWIDGVEVGTAPLTRYIPVGVRQVRVAANGYDPFVRRVDLVRDIATRVEARLTPGRGTVEFVCNVPGARVFIDGKEAGPVPIRLRDLSPGNHTWRIEAHAHEPASEPFTFTPGENLLIPVTLGPSIGLFFIRSEPEGALVALDGREVGTTPLDLTGIPSGPHGVRLSLVGRADVFRAVDTSDGTRGEVTASLPEEGSALVVHTGRSDASVALNACPVGTGRRVRVPEVERGLLRVVVEAAGQAPAERQVRVPASGAVRLSADLVPAGGSARSQIEDVPPLVRRKGFWAVVGGVAAAGAAGGVALAVALAPEPPPGGDVTVTLP